MTTAQDQQNEALDFFRKKLAFTTGPYELAKMLGEVNVIDVRAREDFSKGHIPGSKNLPQDEWGSTEALSKERANVILCYSQTCHLAAKAAAAFAERGFQVMELEGGWKTWTEFRLPVEK